MIPETLAANPIVAALVDIATAAKFKQGDKCLEPGDRRTDMSRNTSARVLFDIC